MTTTLTTESSSAYRKISKLGEGSYGEVYLVENMIRKELAVSKEIKMGNYDEATVIQLFTEAKILENLKHPFIIELKESYKTSSDKLVMILEYAEGGDLAKMVQQQKGTFFEEDQVKS